MNPPQTKCWRILRRCLVGLGVFLTLICLFYTEELWRGKRAWENCKHALEAQGVDFKWADCIPAPVPKDENVFGVPEMQKWFTGRGATELSKKMVYPGVDWSGMTTRLTVVELTIGLPGVQPPEGSVVLRWDDPASRTAAARLLTNALGPTGNAPQSQIGIGFMLRRPEDIQPARIFLQCQTAPTQKDLQQFLPDKIFHANTDPHSWVLKFEPDGNGSYRVSVPMLATVADYLAWSEQLEPQFALIRQALQRPYARMEGNYAEPEQIPIPNFLAVRTLAQTLGARAQCHFLLGQPEEALRDLTLLNDSCRHVMEENKPMTLMSAMINVAVRGLSAGVIADGMRLQVWREPQLAALEEQLKQINLLLPVKQAFETERALMSYYLETAPSKRMVELVFDQPARKLTSSEALEKSVLAEFIPRGWIYKNLAVGVNFYARVTASLDPANQIVFFDKMSAADRDMAATLSHWSPYNFILLRMIPNLNRAFQTTAHNQTLVHQALIACALERYRLARGEYPVTLDALIPQFIDMIPHDVIGGQLPHYRRAADGTFILYSIGWNGRDNGGVRGKSNAEGDWVWPD
jgi:hypothetical protein